MALSERNKPRTEVQNGQRLCAKHNTSAHLWFYVSLDHLKLPRDPMKVVSGSPMDPLKILTNVSSASNHKKQRRKDLSFLFFTYIKGKRKAEINTMSTDVF